MKGRIRLDLNNGYRIRQGCCRIESPAVFMINRRFVNNALLTDRLTVMILTPSMTQDIFIQW